MTKTVHFTEPIDYEGLETTELAIDYYSDAGDSWKITTTAGETMTFSKEIVDRFE